MKHSAKELEHYQRVREQFEKAEDDDSKKKSKGKGKAIEMDIEIPGMQVANGKGKGKAVMVDYEDGREVEDAGLGAGTARLQLDLGSVGAGQWEDSAEKDDEDLYGVGS